MKNTVEKGKITEASILLWCIKNNIVVSIPYGNTDKYDQVWDVDGFLYRVQIKTCRKADDLGEVIVFDCYSVSNKKKQFYSKKDIDFFATYYNGEVYLIPVDECHSEKKLRISDSLNRSKYAKNTNWGTDYSALSIIRRMESQK